MKLAIFGGTFDPIHAAHVEVARAAANRFALDQVLFVTSGNPPHKESAGTADYVHRHRMVEIACQADPRFVPSRIEEGKGKSYTVYTIQHVRAKLGDGDRLYFLIGADAFAEIGTWYRAEELIRSVHFIVVTRPGCHYEIPEGASVASLDKVEIPVSSSEIRREISGGRQPEGLSDAVFEYIREHNLYDWRPAVKASQR